MKKVLAYAGLAVLVVAMVSCATGAKLTPKEQLVQEALNPEGYKALFLPRLSNAIMEDGGWAWEGDELVAQGKGDIWTKERYGDFALDLEFKCAPDTNSGVFIRTDDIERWLHTAIEVQILQPNDDYENPRHHCGGIFDCLTPSQQMVKAPGEWNDYTIIAEKNMIYVILNGVMVTEMNLDLWTEPHKNPDGTKNKFRYAYKDMAREGHIGLQYHGHPIAFRNLKIKPL